MRLCDKYVGPRLIKAISMGTFHFVVVRRFFAFLNRNCICCSSVYAVISIASVRRRRKPSSCISSCWPISSLKSMRGASIPPWLPFCLTCSRSSGREGRKPGKWQSSLFLSPWLCPQVGGQYDVHLKHVPLVVLRSSPGRGTCDASRNSVGPLV